MATKDYRAWVEEACPEEIRGRGLSYGGGTKNQMPGEAFERWFDACVERGFTVPQWPVAYGGAGLDRSGAKALADAMIAVGAPLPLFGTGTTMLGSTLLEYGTEDQKLRHLPRIARGDVAWCQGYSEPGAGSDLASLRTRADDHGDYYLVNGSKIWTSNAHMSDWIFCLVRTDQYAPKQQGISFLLFSLDTPGVTVRNFDLINGRSDFCEAFFDDVKVPKNDLVGRENDGWTIAKRLLQHERNSVSKGEFLPRAGSLPVVLKQYADNDPAARENVLRIEMDDAAFQLTKVRAIEESKEAGTSTFATSTFKLLSSEIESRKLEATVAMMGAQGLGWSGDAFSEDELSSTRKWLLSKGFLIAGGSSEVQRNVVAKRVLGLPD
jgi:alkylation response protein AidB-like acyl-CoA dehydrogenase